MVRSVVGDETQIEARVDALFASRRTAQIGLLVGKLAVVSSVRDLVFALIPTPATDGEEPAKMTPLPSDPKGSKEGGGSSRKGGSKKGKTAADSSSSLTVDSEWVAEHARQVSRMLVGGMEVVGIFVFATETAFKNSTAIFWQVVRAVATASPIHVDGNEVVERLLLHISSSPRRLSCRSCAVDSGFSSAGLRPCDWKLGKVLSSLHTFVCSHPVEFSVPMVVKAKDTPRKTVKSHLFSAFAMVDAHLKSSVALVDGLLADEDKILGPGTTTATPHKVELLLPPTGNNVQYDLDEGQKVTGIVTLNGVVHAWTFALSREPLHHALLDLKGDIIASLKARLDLLCDEAEQALEDAQDKDIISPQETSAAGIKPSHSLLTSSDSDQVEYRVSLPQRVLVPWYNGASFCDYLLPTETLEEVKARCMELFALDQPLDPSQIIQLEASALTSSSSFVSEVRKNICKKGGGEDIVGELELGKLQMGAKDIPLGSKILNSVNIFAWFGAVISVLLAVLFALFLMRL
ncbi:unnamed protein product [Sphagnum tenellum]